MDDLWGEVEAQYQSQLDNIGDEVVKLMKQSVQECIYDYYQPVEYQRTNMFLDSVTFHHNWRDGSLFVFSDINTGYYSAVDGSDQSMNINKWLEYGHSDGGTGEYHNYEGRNFLERARELIKNKYPELNVEIVTDEEF